MSDVEIVEGDEAGVYVCAPDGDFLDESAPVAAAGYECSAAETVVAGKPVVEDVFPWGVAWVEVLDYPLGLKGLDVGGEVHDASPALFLW